MPLRSVKDDYCGFFFFTSSFINGLPCSQCWQWFMLNFEEKNYASPISAITVFWSPVTSDIIYSSISRRTMFTVILIALVWSLLISNILSNMFLTNSGNDFSGLGNLRNPIIQYYVTDNVDLFWAQIWSSFQFHLISLLRMASNDLVSKNNARTIDQKNVHHSIRGSDEEGRKKNVMNDTKKEEDAR